MFNRLSVALLTLAVAAVAAPAARADDPPYIPLTSLLPGLPTGYVPSYADECRSGRARCVDAVIRDMVRRYTPLERGCRHDAIFSLAYLLTTKEYRRTIQDPDFFEDTEFVNHEDAVFAAYYFGAFDAWYAGRRSAVPPAWRIAFDAANQREATTLGNLLLGMNAHIQRDLPFALAAIGLAKPDGSTRKTDHDRVDFFLNRVTDELRAAIVARFDPHFDDTNVPTYLDEIANIQVVALWREVAWRNAERLVSAKTELARKLVTADIEAYAASQAQLIRTALRYLPGQSSAARDAYCALAGD